MKLLVWSCNNCYKICNFIEYFIVQVNTLYYFIDLLLFYDWDVRDGVLRNYYENLL